MGKMEIMIAFLFGVIITLFAMNTSGIYDTVSNTPTGAVIYEYDPQEMVSVAEDKINYSFVSEAFRSSDVSTYAAECEPHAYIIGDNVTKYACNLYFEDKVDVKKVSPTGSMWPNLISGGYVLVKGIRNISELSVGDIVIISDIRGMDIAHRITEISYDNLGQYIITQGDNNVLSDGIRFRFEDVEAKVVGILY